ncbi:pseudouridine synthase [Gemmatimonadota bacterium]
MRLNRYLASAGVTSRRKADVIIREGHVVINGEPATEPWLDVDPDRDRVEVDGKRIEPLRDRLYLLMHKPTGVITTVSDPQGRPTVLSLLGDAWPDRRLSPVGRLDADTSGALLLSDDGELAYRLTHPSFESLKVYQVRCGETVEGASLTRLEAGLELEDGPAPVDTVRRIDPYTVEVGLHIGRKRIVRRMFAALGYSVAALHRSGFAGLSADDIEPGSWRELTSNEVEELQRGVGIDPDD